MAADAVAVGCRQNPKYREAKANDETYHNEKVAPNCAGLGYTVDGTFTDPNEENQGEKDPDTIEIHNHVPGDDEEAENEWGRLNKGKYGDLARNDDNRRQRDDEENGVVARYPASYHAHRGRRALIYSQGSATRDRPPMSNGLRTVPAPTLAK